MNEIVLLFGALALGLVHALDADHVMAVSVLSSKENKFLAIVKSALKWGSGHGLILTLVGILFIWLDYGLNDALVASAENLAGIILIVLGVATLLRICKGKLQLSNHTHGQVKHTHWIKKYVGQKTHNHTPVFVGMVHGLAGSAPIIAITPMLMQTSAVYATAYIILFSLGCILGMAFFALIWGKLCQKVQTLEQWIINLSHAVLGGLSISLGFYWLS
ncbi:sulfite exporter TauE/SafE family protein [Catenovulum sp. 2E275]|uniref:urease accessory protein UreH domain-containing protein n=1 Tax=Catenovulum sp. 2E275 TaxID=2980497 RepID=UPI0021D0976B|nr:sulfite exporter TauE/SafE family protein [Catenovulum sp. 2E275]MCU4674192.1 sulfite exporter TauE/SafE family protein [Catenovulum sp. 2E275]